MIFDILIARANDGLLLCEVINADTMISTQDSRRQLKAMFRKGMAQEEIKGKIITLEQDNQSMYQTENGIIYLVIYDKRMHDGLALSFLDELKKGFIQELQKQYGTQGVDYRSKVETLSNSESYKFQGFERIVKKLKVEFQDPNSTQNVARIKKELSELNDIMHENIRLLVDRENSLNDMSIKAKSLKEDSKMFKDKSSDLVWQLWIRKNSIWLVAGVAIVAFIFFKIY